MRALPPCKQGLGLAASLYVGPGTTDPLFLKDDAVVSTSDRQANEDANEDDGGKNAASNNKGFFMIFILAR
jgi:hypothetical protein